MDGIKARQPLAHTQSYEGEWKWIQIRLYLREAFQRSGIWAKLWRMSRSKDDEKEWHSRPVLSDTNTRWAPYVI